MALSIRPPYQTTTEGEWLWRVSTRCQIFVNVSAKATAFNIAFDLFTVS